MNRNARVDITDFEPIPEKEELIDKVQTLTASLDARYKRGDYISPDEIRELSQLEAVYSEIDMTYHAQSKAHRKQIQAIGVLEDTAA